MFKEKKGKTKEGGKAQQKPTQNKSWFAGVQTCHSPWNLHTILR